MFVLTELKDNVRIPPEQFNIKLCEALRDEIDRKLANKVLLNVGLCIALKDIVSVKDSIILPGDGASHTEVVFRYIVFRPMVGNVLTGKIRSCSQEGVHVTLGFFDDILIPSTTLQHPSRYDEAERAWVWEYHLDDGQKHDLYMDIGESIKFRVAREIFEESSPTGPPKNESLQQQCQSSNSANHPIEAKTPYKIIGAINESGLGVLAWWDQQQQTEDDEEDDNNMYDDDENGEGAYEE